VEILQKSRAAAASCANQVEWLPTVWSPATGPSLMVAAPTRELFSTACSRTIPFGQMTRKCKAAVSSVARSIIAPSSAIADVCQRCWRRCVSEHAHQLYFDRQLGPILLQWWQRGGANQSTLYNCTVSGNSALSLRRVERTRALFTTVRCLATQLLMAVVWFPIHFGTVC